MSVDKPFTKEKFGFQENYPNVLNGDNLADILNVARAKRNQ